MPDGRFKFLLFFCLEFDILKCFTKCLPHSGIIWRDVLLMDEALPEAVLSEFSLQVLFESSLELLFLLNDGVWYTDYFYMLSGFPDHCQTLCCQQIFSSSTGYIRLVFLIQFQNIFFWVSNHQKIILDLWFYCWYSWELMMGRKISGKWEYTMGCFKFEWFDVFETT